MDELGKVLATLISSEVAGLKRVLVGGIVVFIVFILFLGTR